MATGIFTVNAEPWPSPALEASTVPLTWNGQRDGAYTTSTLGKSLEEENRRLKQIVADLTLDNQALKTVASKKW